MRPLRHLLVCFLWQQGFRLTSRTWITTALLPVTRHSTTAGALTLDCWEDTSSSRATGYTQAWPLLPPPAGSTRRNTHSKRCCFQRNPVAVFWSAPAPKIPSQLSQGPWDWRFLNGLEWWTGLKGSVPDFTPMPVKGWHRSQMKPQQESQNKLLAGLRMHTNL